MSLYGGAKAAVRCMVRSWIQDIKGSGIRINVLSAVLLIGSLGLCRELIIQQLRNGFRIFKHG